MGYELNDKYRTLFAGYWAPDALPLLFKKAQLWMDAEECNGAKDATGCIDDKTKRQTMTTKIKNTRNSSAPCIVKNV